MGGFWGSRGGVGLGGQSGCDRRIEVFGKIHKKNGGGGSGWWGGGVRVDVNEELKFLCLVKIQIKNWGRGVGLGGVRVDVNKELKFLGREGVRWGVGLVGGQGGCERNVGGRG